MKKERDVGKEDVGKRQITGNNKHERTQSLVPRRASSSGHTCAFSQARFG